MRCKNCGSENDDNLYICQNCGSPLYDEDEDATPDVEKTQVFAAQGKRNAPNPKNNNNKNDDDKKKQTIIIIVLCVILFAVIAGTVIAGVRARHKNNEPSSLTQVSTSQTTTKKLQPTTTTTTTETTTTTTTTEAPSKLSVTLTCNDGGVVEGEGMFELGDEVTVYAEPDTGYDFDGWYLGNKKVSSKSTYTFTITQDTKLKAVFVIVDDTDVEIIGDDEE